MRDVLFRELGEFKSPFSIFSLFKEEVDVVFLDGGKDFEGDGRYSFIGVNPFIKLKGNTEGYEINGEFKRGDILKEIARIEDEYRCDNQTGVPFIAGGMGYFSYDLGREFEKLPKMAREDVIIPRVYFNFYDNVIIFDNMKEICYISSMGILKDKEESIEELERDILNAQEVLYEGVPDLINYDMFSSNFNKDEYMSSVKRVRDYIKSGDVYIMNMTQRFKCEVSRDSYEIYKDLRSINPAQFGSFMRLDGFDILSCSPERFLRIKDGIVDTRPIKGTRPRGKTPEEDLKNRIELENSDKDKSELLMIVDLERNDLSKVCKPRTVNVTELFEIEEYPTVFHLVANIQGELQKDKGIIDCIRAAFPGGSITGAPKIRSMEIIDELEKVRRNIYTGSIGYIGFDGNSDMNIVIRSIMINDNKGYFGVGGGITWESEEEFEYQETLQKGYALMRALTKE